MGVSAQPSPACSCHCTPHAGGAPTTPGAVRAGAGEASSTGGGGGGGRGSRGGGSGGADGVSSAAGGVEVLRSEGLIVRIALSGGGVVGGSCVAILCYGNDASTPVSNLAAQVAVPKHLRMQLGPPSDTCLPPEPLPGFGPTLPPITQTLRLAQVGRPPYKPLKVRLRLAYEREGKHIVEEATIGPESFGQGMV
uniref:Gamma adaptin ear domain protein n=1 Tax=Isochrysis galbana TaxID=37099 RepID=A0A0M3SAP2_ISOGA|nr:gamma adaptin ear domain protein [Isochrysis galbana]